jgi:hypothetical protein
LYNQPNTTMNPTEKRCQATVVEIVAVCIILLSIVPLKASPALDFSLNGAHLENQSVTATLGWEFSVNQAVRVTHLGLFDSGQDGLLESHTIGIWSTTGNSPLFQATIPAGNATLLDGNFRYIPILEATLQPGSYVIGAQYFGISADARVSDASGIVTDPRIAYLGSRYGIGSNLPYPSTASGAGHYFGPSFQLVAVPEPSTVALLGLGGITLVVGVLRKRHTRRYCDPATARLPHGR